VDTSFNCSGQPLQVLRVSAGVYVIDFPGNPGTSGMTSVRGCPSVCFATPPTFLTVAKLTAGIHVGDFVVLARQIDPGHAPQDADFNILIP
jgi:hypothetical protein